MVVEELFSGKKKMQLYLKNFLLAANSNFFFPNCKYFQQHCAVIHP